MANNIPDIYMGGYGDRLTEFTEDLISPQPGYYFRTLEDCIAYMCKELHMTGELKEIPVTNDICRVFKGLRKDRFSDNVAIYLYIWCVSPYVREVASNG